MKLSSILPVTVASLAVAVPNPSAGNNLVARATLQQITNHLSFEAPISEFNKARDARNPPQLDWSSDGCSSSPDTPGGVNFLPSCQRHDFGYRNFKGQHRFTDQNKAKIDKKLHDDLYRICSIEAKNDETACHATAEVYYNTVKYVGKRDEHAEETKEEEGEGEEEASDAE